VVKYFVELGVPADVRAMIKSEADQLISQMAEFALNGMLKLFGLDINPFMGGNKLFDIILNGGVFSANQSMQVSLGLHTIDSKTAAAQTQQYLAEQREYNRNKGWTYALFSPEATGSVTSRLISRLSPSSNVIDNSLSVANLMLDVTKDSPSTLASVLTGSASATSYTSPEAVLNADAYGLTDAELSAPLNEAVSSGATCDAGTSFPDQAAAWMGFDTTKKPYDSCQFDTFVATGVLCSMDKSAVETAECNPDAQGNGASTAVPAGTCPTGTNLVQGITKGWKRGASSGEGTEQNIVLCTIPGTEMSTIPHWTDDRYEGTSAKGLTEIAVNSEAAASFLQMATKAKEEGVTLSASIGYRSLYEQCSIVIRSISRPSVCPSWITAIPGNWTSSAVYSNHMMGYSVDFTP
jgi:hypothetical protein